MLAPPPLPHHPDQSFNRQAFEAAIGTSFQVTPVSGNKKPVWLNLIAVHDLPALVPVNAASMAVPPPKSKTVTTTGFVLSFTSTGALMPQGTYTFVHAGIGSFTLLIVPGRTKHDVYNAVINHLQ